MKQLAKDVFFEHGFKNGAIYNLNTSEVYSVNDIACDIIERVTAGEKISDKEQEYINTLRQNGVFENEIDRTIPCSSPEQYLPRETFDIVWLEITQACNMRCLHCYEGSIHAPASSGQRLTLAEWKEIIDQIHELGARRIVVIGGEPTVVPCLEGILDHLYEKQMDTTLFTNASFQDDSLFELICNHKTKIKFSLYGHNAEVHDSITQHPGSFERLVANIKSFLERDVHVTAAIVLMKENEQYVHEIESFVKALGIKQYKFDVIREVYSGQQSEHKPTRREIINLGLISQPYFRLTRERFYAFFNKNTCWNRKLVISETGIMLPCVFARNEIIGNIRRTSLKELLHSKELSRFWDYSFDNVDGCGMCEFKYACKDCRPLAIAVRGRISEKNPRCCYDPQTGEWKLPGS